jgi:subtilisin family serine protease
MHLQRVIALYALLCISILSFSDTCRAIMSNTARFRNDRLLIKPKPHANREQLDQLHERNHSKILRVFPGIGNVQVLQIPPGTTPECLSSYLDSGLIEYAEPDYFVRIAGIFPNDPKFMDGTLWGLNNAGQDGGKPGADIDAPEAWANVHAGGNVIVAIVDTGVRYTHEDLVLNMWTNPVDATYGTNAVNGTLDPMDDNGHGTTIAGVIGAVGNNGVGIAGVAWQAKIMACKFIDEAGDGTVSDAIACLDYARTHGAHIINASWGLAELSLSLSNAFQAVRAAGIIVVAAAGNDSQNNDIDAFYPANFALDNIVAVAATTRTDTLYALSNFGSTNVDLAAPGFEIYSTSYNSDNAYAFDQGTSIAAAFVSGAMALLRFEYPEESVQQLIQRLLLGTDTLPDLSGLCSTSGRLNLRRSLGIPIVPPNLEIAARENTLAVRLLGDPGRTYVIETNTTLTNWNPIFTNVTGFAGTFVFTNPAPIGEGKLFFRARLDQ